MSKNISTGQYRKFFELLDQKDVTDERFQAAFPFLADILDSSADLSNREAVRAALKLGRLVSDILRLTVDYGQSLEAMIAAGRYDWKNDDITAKRFPTEGQCIVEFETRYFQFDRNISSEKAIEAMKEAGWEPAKIEHLLCFGEKHPDEQRKSPIIALASVAEVNGDRHVPYLRRLGSERDLNLYWFGHDWDPVCRFLAVRKVSAA